MSKRRYTPEFKAEVVALCRAGDWSCAQVSRDLGVNYTTLMSWMDTARAVELKHRGHRVSRKGVGTTPWPRASSPRSRPSCRALTAPMPRPAGPFSSTLRSSTTGGGGIRALAISLQPSSKTNSTSRSYSVRSYVFTNWEQCHVIITKAYGQPQPKYIPADTEIPLTTKTI
jgi:transposase-like protein